MRHRFIVLVAAALAASAAPAAATPQYDVTAALQNLRAGRAGEALTLLTRAIDAGTLAPRERADALEWRAFLHERRGDRRAARTDLDAAIRAEGANPLRHRARARFLMRTGNPAAALADMETVMSRSSSDAENYADLCEIQAALGRRAEARTSCERALKVDPGNARARATLRRLGRN